MTTNQRLKKDLLAKLGIQPAGLSKRAQAKKREVPMSTAEATYLIAHEAGLHLDRYLTPEEVVRIRGLHSPGNKAAIAGRNQEPRRKNNRATEVRELRFPGDIRISNPLLDSSKLAEATAMSRVFPLLYVLENSIRELIKRVMANKFGADWWDTQLTSGKLKNVHQKAQGRMASEKKSSWHQKRGAHPIDYADIDNLEDIIKGKQDCFFPHIIPDLPWFEHFMKEIYPSRNVVCHMNPLNDDNVRDLQLKLKKWENTINSAKAAIPD